MKHETFHSLGVKQIPLQLKQIQKKLQDWISRKQSLAQLQLLILNLLSYQVICKNYAHKNEFKKICRSQLKQNEKTIFVDYLNQKGRQHATNTYNQITQHQGSSKTNHSFCNIKSYHIISTHIMFIHALQSTQDTLTLIIIVIRNAEMFQKFSHFKTYRLFTNIFEMFQKRLIKFWLKFSHYFKKPYFLVPILTKQFENLKRF
eukprot:TRINITY_DN3859_c0_g1_i16.p3 TRINITY_DN3859_c0_g1~~TRINITY_DN3859_c0_g1_i16.p3  ORF type:complete len:203 (+),score=-19.20 TRINITY_DN3859_c0_g1_i16:3020-3628(+)